MATTEHRGLLVRRAACVVAGVALAALLTAAPAGATGTGAAPKAAPAAPQLSIAVDDGRTSTTAGETLEYAITIRNLGTAGVRDLQVTQTLPAGLSLEKADAAGSQRAGSVGWTLDLAAAGNVVVHSTTKVSDTPPELLRLATVACASMSAGGPPIVCASHSDQLPAGATAEAAARAPSIGPAWWYVAGGIGLLAAVALVLVLRRRTAARHHQIR